MYYIFTRKIMDVIVIRAGLKPSGPRARVIYSRLLSSTHNSLNNTLYVLQRTTILGRLVGYLTKPHHGHVRVTLCYRPMKMEVMRV